MTVPRSTRIAIAGATGRVGSALTDLLAGESVDVVALTRDPAKAAFPAGVSGAAVDFAEPRTLTAALSGVERLFLSQGSSPQQVANEIALIDAAVAAKVRHIVKLSAMGPPTRLYPMAWHMQIEAHLAAAPIASTVLRPSAFFDILRYAAPQVAAGAWAGAAGSGRVNFIDTRDVAEAARTALNAEIADDAQLAYHLTGPRTWTLQQVAVELSSLLGRVVSYTPRTPDEQRAVLAARSVPPFAVDLLLGLDKMFAESVLAETTTTVEELTGHAPRPLVAWLRENIALFR